MIYVLMGISYVIVYLMGHFFGFTEGRRKLTIEIKQDGVVRKAHITLAQMSEDEAAEVKELLRSTLAKSEE